MDEYENTIAIVLVVFSLPLYLWLRLQFQKFKISLADYYDQRDRNKAIIDHLIASGKEFENESCRNTHYSCCLCRCCCYRNNNGCTGDIIDRGVEVKPNP